MAGEHVEPLIHALKGSFDTKHGLVEVADKRGCLIDCMQPDSAFCNSYELYMGPVRTQDERLSSYRFRYARYCLVWLIPLGLGTLLLMAFRPDVANSSWPLVTMFLYFGLPIGAGTALTAMVGFILGGIWAGMAESSVETERFLKRIQYTAIAIIVMPMCGLALYLSYQGLLSGEVHAFGKNIRWMLHRDEQPGWFYLNVAIWAAVGIGGGYMSGPG